MNVFVHGSLERLSETVWMLSRAGLAAHRCASVSGR
jgi:hypothetical protein